MGNAASQPSRPMAGGSNLISDMGPELQYEKSMGNSRFLRAIKARHRLGAVVVKTYVKPDVSMSLRSLVRRLRIERETLADVPNVLTYQKVVETATAGCLMRQWMFSNLYDRISTRPFLTPIEKKWISYQLLYAMGQASARKVAHGDLKCENVLVTSSLSVYITDFAASFKPAFLPLNDPSDFNFFFGSSGRRTCYIAPERFYAEDSRIAKQKAQARVEAQGLGAMAPLGKPGGGGSEGASNLPPGDPAAAILGLGSKRDGKVTEAMDVFALGCVLAELWRDGAPTFTLTQLLKYREGGFDIDASLADVTDAPIRELIRAMISLEPAQRPTFDACLAKARGSALPEVFYSFIHPYLTTLQRISPSRSSRHSYAEGGPSAAGTSANASHVTSAAAAVAAAASSSDAAISSTAALVTPMQMRTEADERLERLYEEWAVVLDGIRDDGMGLDGTRDVDGVQTPRFEDRAAPPALLDREVAEAESSQRASDRLRQRATASGNRVLPMLLNIPGIPPDVLLTGPAAGARPVVEDGPAVLLLNVILSNLRTAVRPSSRTLALDLLLHLASRWLTDETKLDRVLPYFVALLKDASPAVRSAAVRGTAQLLMLVGYLTPSNAVVMAEYVLPNLRHVLSDTSSMVRTMYALCLAELCQTAQRFLQITHAMRAAGVFDIDGIDDDGGLDAAAGLGRRDDFDGQATGGVAAVAENSYGAQLRSLSHAFQEQVAALLTDPSATVKRALLANIGPLCRFLGPGPSNDVLLSHMITYLNDRSWHLRHAFFDAIVDIADVVGPLSVHEYIVPLMLQALSDSEEFVVCQVLHSLARLARGGARRTASDDASKPTQGSAAPTRSLLTKADTLDVAAVVAGFLCHPNFWLRSSAARVIEACCEDLGAAETWAMVYPSIRPLLRSDVERIDELNLLEFAKPPLSRAVLQAAMAWAARVSKSRFWKPEQPADARDARMGLGGGGGGLGREGIGLMAGRRGRALPRTPIQRSEEDDGYMDKLRAVGMAGDDEIKLVALRDYVWKVAKQASSRSPSSSSTPSSAMGGVAGGKALLATAADADESGAGGLPALRIKSTFEAQPLEGVTPLTIFFTPNARPSGPGAGAGTGSRNPTLAKHEADSAAGFGSTLQSPTTASTSTAMARRRMAGVRTASVGSAYSPFEEIRRRMNMTTSTTEGGGDTIRSASSSTRGTDAGKALPYGGPNEESARSAGGASGATQAEGGGGDDGHSISSHARLGKAAPAVASSSAKATGQMADVALRMRLNHGSNRDGRDSARSSVTRGPLGRPGLHDVGHGGGGDDADHAEDGGEVEPAFTSTYEGGDPYIQAHLEAVFLANFRGRDARWGPVVQGPNVMALRRRGGARANLGGGGGRVPPMLGSAGGSNRRPEGNLIAYFNEHSAAVTALAVSPDHVFFCSGSEDGTVKVWDTARLEKNVTSRSRATYAGQTGAVTALLALQGSHCLASASTDGSVHVIRVDVQAASSMPRYGKVRLVSNFQLSTPGEYPTALLQSCASPGTPTSLATSEGGAGSTLVLGTNRSRLTVLDLRTMQVLQTLRQPSHFGGVTCVCADAKNIWLLVGTMGGVVALWDLRFGLLLKSWRVGVGGVGATEGGMETTDEEPGRGRSTAAAAALSVKVTHCVPHPSKGRGRWVMIAYQRSLAQGGGASGRGGGGGGGGVGGGVDDAAMGGGAPPTRAETLVETWDIDRVAVVETYQASFAPPRHAANAAAAAAAGADEPSRGSHQAARSRTAPTAAIVPPEPDSGTRSPAAAVSTLERRAASVRGNDDGLESAAAAIERLVRLSEERHAAMGRDEDEGGAGGGVGAGEVGDAGTDGAVTGLVTKEAVPRRLTPSVAHAVPPTYLLGCGVHAMVVALEGYASSSSPTPGGGGNGGGVGQVADGWVDAGRLAKGSDGGSAATTRGAEASSHGAGGGSTGTGRGAAERSYGSSPGPSGYMITAGEDRRIRFWDLGRADKGVCVGTVDERSEFRPLSSVAATQTSSRGVGAGQVHFLWPNSARANGHGPSTFSPTATASSSSPSTALARASVRSPLLSHNATSVAHALLRCHRDAVTALATLEHPFRCVVAADRSGSIKVWE